MTKQVIAILQGQAVTKSTDYEAAPGGTLAFLNYKETKDKVTGKANPKPSAFVVCYPALVLPVLSVAALDVILRSAMEGYAESLCRQLREQAGNPETLEIDLELSDGEQASEAWLAVVIEHAEEKAAGSKLSERVISAWFKAEGEDACKASYMAANGIGTEDTPENVAKQAQVTQAVANMGVLFAKLAAPTPDISPEIAEVLLTRLSVLEEPSGTTQAIRQKLQQRVDMKKKAMSLLAGI